MHRLSALTFVIIFACCSCNSNKNETGERFEMITDTTKPRPNPFKDSKIDFRIFSNDTTADSSLHGFGYNIYVDSNMYVHQPHIPAVSGNKGFDSYANAEKAAGLIVYKIKNNILPPSVTPHELDSIGALK